MTTTAKSLSETIWEAIDDKGIKGRLHREDCDYIESIAYEWFGRTAPVRNNSMEKTR